MTNYFSEAEQACSHCGAIKLAEGFLDRLNELREEFGFPMHITSMCRCKAHNTAIGGKPDSFHLTSHPFGCCAIDVSTTNWTSQKKWKFVNMAMQKGWSVGINWNKGFIHIDRRSHYPDSGWPEPVIFQY